VTIDRALNFEDLRRLARRRLPRIIFDYVEGGVDDEAALGRNPEAFARFRLMPRYMVDVTKRSQTTELFGRTYASPFGIAPTGMAGIVRRDADLMLAEAAAAANVPFILSGVSTSSIEAVAKAAQGRAWYQLYIAHDRTISQTMIGRAHDAGIETLVVTVDVPTHGKRERNIRNGWVRPYRPTLPAMIETLAHPQWLAEYLRHGLPYFENWVRHAGPGASPKAIAGFLAAQMPCSQTWTDIEAFRHMWPGKLVVKGIMHPADAVRAVELGADGVVVSNHGGRQLDRGPAAIDAFPAVEAAVGDRATLMMDSGIRRGADIVTALCLGARFTFVGRATLYGVTAAGRRGASRALDILRNELDLVLAQIGCPDVRRLGPDYLFSPHDMARLSDDGGEWPVPRPERRRVSVESGP
jgi:L-lactate dehydrogenase (cytochrome)/(S)-mandelate dehydrogenase